MHVPCEVLTILSWLVLLVAAGGDAPGTPAEQYRALCKEYDRASSSGVALTDEQRMQFIGRVYKQRSELALKFLELAKNHPKDPIALDALTKAVWQVNTTPWPVALVGDNPARGQALELLSRDHVQSERLGPVCERVANGFSADYESFLRAVLEKNPHKSVQGIAHLSLGHFLKSRGQQVELCRERPDLARDFAALYGEAYLKKLLSQDRQTTEREIEALFESAATKYANVTLPGGPSVVERARAELFEVRNLSVGKEAPDIHGEDQDGQRFRLRDYRGKVVLLDFWSFV